MYFVNDRPPHLQQDKCVCIRVCLRERERKREGERQRESAKAFKPFLFVVCFHPLLILMASPKSGPFAQVSSPVHTNTKNPPPPPSEISPSLISRALCCGRGERSLSLMFGGRRRAWCRRQAGHWWRLAPPHDHMKGCIINITTFCFSPSTSPELPACVWQVPTLTTPF